MWRRKTQGLFGLGGPGGGRTAIDFTQVRWAVIDLETTGLSPTDDRIVELAVVTVDPAGKVIDEYSTLLDPGRDVGPTWIHHITNDAVRGAPQFGDIAGEILSRLDGAVAVAHNASFEEAFLLNELRRYGVDVPTVPAICTLELARTAQLPTPNHRLGTCCSHYGVDCIDAHTALGDTRATAAMLPALISDVTARFGTLGFPIPPTSVPSLAVSATPRHRVSGLRKGDRGWMAGIIDKLPVVPGEADPAAADAYLDALSMALSDGKIIGTEAKQLARLAGQAGMGSDQVRALHHRFLDGMREVALADGIVTPSEAKELKAAAKALSEPDYFEDLVVTAEQARASGAEKKRSSSVGPLAGVRVLLVDDAPELQDTLAGAGAALAKNVTASLRCVITSDPSDRRAFKAADMGIAVVSPADALAHLGLSEQPATSETELAGALGDTGTVVTGVGVDQTDVSPGIAEPQHEGAGLEAPVTKAAPPPAAPPGWYTDPFGRYPLRWWDGIAWSGYASVNGVSIWDPQL